MGDIALHTTPYGRPAAQLLRERISAAKVDDPLRPVTIVVPTNYVGVSTRRLLAAGTLGPITSRGNGIAGLTLLTVYRLAELLGAPALAAAGRRPVSTPVLAAAVRQVLGRQPGLFRDVATHPSTEEGLVRVHRELSELSSAALDRLSGRSVRADDVVRIHREVRRQLEPAWFVEADLMQAATAAVEGGSSILADVGTVLVYLPQSLTLPGAALLSTVAQRQPVEVIAARTGVPAADAEVDLGLHRLGLEVPAEPAEPPAAATAVISVSDPEEEVRSAVEQIIAAARRGVPLECMAVLYPSVEPYARLAHEQLTQAGIAYNGRAVRPLSDRLLGRWLLDLLSLPSRRFSRPAVMGLLGAAPMKGRDGARVSVGTWERISRDAGIVREPAHWLSHLTTFAEESRAHADDEAQTKEPREWLVAQRTRAADDAEALRVFVGDLFGHIAAAQRLRTWQELAQWCVEMVRRYVGDERRRGQWPLVERNAAELVEDALDRLKGLDSVEQGTTLDVFRRTLELELDADLGRVGVFGKGVLVGTMSAALGVDLDVVIVLGLAEGVLPTRPREDSLLPDVERAAAGDELPLRTERTGVEHRQLLAAMQAAKSERVLVFPRGDQRRSIERVPSRWLLDSCEALTGERALPEDAAWHRSVPSFANRVAGVAFPANGQEYGLRALQGCSPRSALLDDPLVQADPAMRRGLELLLNRGRDAFTRFDGNLADLAKAIPSPTDPDALVSATQLESWISCPHAYLMQYVLKVRPVENPEELLEIDALSRGSLVHDVLERWLLAQLAGPLPDPDTPWPEASRRQMRQLAEEACDAAEARGVTGHPLLWQRDRQHLLLDLERFIDEDNERRRELCLTPQRPERPFGMDGANALTIDLGDGTAIRVRGRIDRVDRASDGAIVVADYKTGSTRRYSDLKDTQPLGDGTKLQLGLYGLAVAADDPDAAIRTEYWFTSTKGDFKRKGYDLTPAVIDSLRNALRIAVDGMASGLFPMKPPEPAWSQFTGCQFCDPDNLGTTDRYREWERVRLAPQLRTYVGFIDPDALEQAEMSS